jgi:GTP-binding protein EngB required for normal cell division
VADLNQRLSDLEETLALATDRLDADTVAAGREVLDKVEARLANGPGSVVVALAGGTGSGKSSLFNALAGAPLTRTGVVRPVTDEVTAWAVGDPQGAASVLDWLQVRRRHQVAPSRLYPEGLVLLDLPDHDSVSADHRLLVDRFVARVDVLVWVVDPLKYAQRALHADYLRRLAAHAKVLVVVLNRVDELGNEAAGIVADDLRQLLAAEGLGRAKLLVTSARTGVGLDRLRTSGAP